jgi:hypothetical protein
VGSFGADLMMAPMMAIEDIHENRGVAICVVEDEA